MRTEEEQLRDDGVAARLLRRLPECTPASVHRVRARIGSLRQGGGSREFPRARGLRLIAIGAMAGALGAGFLMGAHISSAPIAPAPVAVASTLQAGNGWAMDTSVPNVALSFDGVGAIQGPPEAPHIKWESGLLKVAVTPDKGVALAVSTREAEVRVVGTGFTVTRDVLGTQVDVRRGRVEVDCGDEGTRALAAGDGVLCLPRSAAGLLGRARALQAAGAPAADALAALERGLAIVGSQAAVRDELSGRRIRALYDLSRHSEVIDAARVYASSGGGGRLPDIEKIAGASASALGGCAVAAPWLLESSAVAAEACRSLTPTVPAAQSRVRDGRGPVAAGVD